jgi:hypothetical protein
MHARSIALAVPLVLGMACTSTRSQSDRTASATPAPTASEPTAASPRDPLSVPGPAIKGHAEDQVVSGTISSVSGDSLSIRSAVGETKQLQIAPETAVKVDGRDASHASLQEGQPVRASFSEVEGREVAVEIRAGDPSNYPDEATSSPIPPAPHAEPESGLRPPQQR